MPVKVSQRHYNDNESLRTERFWGFRKAWTLSKQSDAPLCKKALESPLVPASMVLTEVLHHLLLYIQNSIPSDRDVMENYVISELALELMLGAATVAIFVLRP